MKRILLTGLSGTGKSTVTNELAIRGHKAVDADCDQFSHWVEAYIYANSAGTPVEQNRDWVWRTDRIQQLMDTDDAEMLFVSGCSPNMGQFIPQFDYVILLSAPAENIVERLALRTNNAYGKQPAERARVLDLIETVEPLLRRSADHEIDTSAPLEDVIEQILQIAMECNYSAASDHQGASHCPERISPTKVRLVRDQKFFKIRIKVKFGPKLRNNRLGIKIDVVNKSFTSIKEFTHGGIAMKLSDIFAHPFPKALDGIQVGAIAR